MKICKLLFCVTFLVGGVLVAQTFSQDANQGALIFKQSYGLLTNAKSKEDLKKAAVGFQKAYEIFLKTGNLKEAGIAANQTAFSKAQLGDLKEALDYYEKAYNAWVSSGDRANSWKPLFNMSDIYRMLGQYDESEKTLNMVLDICSEPGNPECLGRAFRGLGLISSVKGNYDKALDYYNQTLDIAQKHDMKTEQAVVLNNMGNVYFRLGDYKRSYEGHKKALEIVREIKDQGNIAAVLNQLAGDEMAVGSFAAAIKTFEESLEINRTLGNKHGEAVALHNLGHCYELLGFFERGMELLNDSVTIKENIGDIPGEAESLSVMGSIHMQLGNYAQALDLFKQSRDLKKKIGEPYHGQNGRIARLYLEMGDLENTEQMLKLTDNLILSGALALRRSDFTLAEDKFSRQLDKSTQSNDLIGRFEANTGLGLLFEATGDLNKARSHFEQAMALVEQIRDGLPESLRSNFYDSSVWYFKRIVPFQGMSRILMKSGDKSGSLEFAESSKARHFAEALSFRGTTTSYRVPVEMLQIDRDINLELAGAQKRYDEALRSGDKQNREQAESYLKKIKKDRETHIAKMRRDYPIFAATKYPEPMKTSQLALKDGEWALEYEITDSGLCVYLLNGGKIVYATFKPIPRNDMLTLVQRFRSKVEVKNNDAELIKKLKGFDFETGNRLEAILLEGVLEFLPEKVPLILVPDDVLGSLPFEMLPLTKEGKVEEAGNNISVKNASFLGDRNQIVYAQSLTALSLSRTLGKRIASKDNVLIFADPVFQLTDERVQDLDVKPIASENKDFITQITQTMSTVEGMGGNFERLPRTGQLAESLKSLFNNQVDLYTGIKATKHNLLETLGPKLVDYNAIIFATHGYLGNKMPGVKEPCLILTMIPAGTDGFLRMSDVLSLDLNSNMVVLTACQSGLGKTVSGEGAMGMGRAFQYAGAKTVLMSLWNVSEEPSVMLVESMLKHLKDGQTKLNALKMARDDLRKMGFDHPFFWAGFVLSGEP
ncbi:MAG: CHAT domain-containing protein [Desulfomonilaceae bacterium]